MAKIMALKTEKKTENRAILHIKGKDAFAFLQGLITNDMAKTALNNNAGNNSGLVYTALLSPQGKYLFDFFVLEDRGDYLGAGYLIDIDAECADGFCQRLTMYKLRAEVQIEKTQGWVARGLGDKTGDKTAYPDPRHDSLGWRSYHFDAPPTLPDTDWNALYVRHLIPKTGVELIPNETYILEAGFERLNGVDFQKGCYVGQEVTARMKHKTTLRKGLARVRLDGVVAIGTDIMAGGKSVGKVLSQADGHAIAHLRFEQAKGEMVAGGFLVVSY